MAKCDCLEKCPFFKAYLDDATAIRKLYVDRCCQGDFTRCARYMVASRFGREKVPIELFPLEVERAKKIIEGLESSGAGVPQQSCCDLG
jgi:hypothetical protein